MGSVKKLTKLVPAIALVAGFAIPNYAQAADLLLDPPVIEIPEVAVQSRSGWYLRGDITYDFRASEGARYYPAAAMFTDVSLEDSWDVGFGLGYQINDNFRVDVTGEYVFGSEWRGISTDSNFVCAGMSTAGGGSVTDGSEPGSCVSVDTANVSAFKLLANGYLDIGNFSGITPYIGAGIGGAYVMYDDFQQVQSAEFIACCAALEDSTVAHKGLNSWRFAYALHAGVSYEMSRDWKLDFGYSYSDIAGGPMANYINVDQPQAYDKGFTEHVIRAGIRYQIW